MHRSFLIFAMAFIMLMAGVLFYAARIPVEQAQPVETAPPVEVAADATTIEMDKVLFVSDGKEIKIGAPYLDGAKVVASFKTAAADSVVKGPKLYPTHFRRRKNSQRKMGHRQKYLQVMIDTIEA